MLAIAAVLSATLVSGVAAWSSWMAAGAPTLPAPTGPFAVGRRSMVWIDSSRADPLSPDSTAKRALVAWVWYPAESTASVRASYLPDAWLRQIDDSKIRARLALIATHAFDSASMVKRDTPFPVLIFSPGLGQSPTGYTALLEDLASHGYVIVAMAHPYNTPVVVFPDGRIARSEESAVPFNFFGTAPILAADLVAAANHVRGEHRRGHAFFSRVDPERIGVFGHSFGGAVAAIACHMDERIKAGVNLDGSMYGEPVTAGIHQPFLLLLAQLSWMDTLGLEPPRYYDDRDQGRLHEKMFLERSPNAYWVDVPGLRHMDFADEAYWFRFSGWLADRVGARLGGHRARALASRYVRAFFEESLNGESDFQSTLSALVADGPPVSIRGIREPSIPRRASGRRPARAQ
jgi:predicted dienelactone hydrolase